MAADYNANDVAFFAIGFNFWAFSAFFHKLAFGYLNIDSVELVHFLGKLAFGHLNLDIVELVNFPVQFLDETGASFIMSDNFKSSDGLKVAASLGFSVWSWVIRTIGSNL